MVNEIKAVTEGISDGPFMTVVEVFFRSVMYVLRSWESSITPKNFYVF